MRRRISLLVAASTSAVVLAFVIPLALLVRTVAEDRAFAAAVQDAQQVSTFLIAEPDPATVTTFVQLVDERSPREVGVLLPDGTRVGSGVPADDDPDLVAATGGRAGVATDDTGRLLLRPVVTAAGTAVVVAAVPFADLRAGVLPAWLTLAALGLGLLGLSVLAADRVGRWASRPVTDLAAVAGRLREGDLTARVAPGGPAEVDALGRSVNRLADRVVDLLRLEREQVADLSHRLRTPVTALRLDVDLVQDRDVADKLRGHVDHLVRTVDQLIAQARRGVQDELVRRCDASAVVAERVAFWSALAEDQERDLRVELPDRPAWVAADPDDLADAVDAVLDNVFAHTPDGSPFAVRVGTDGRGARVVVTDAGPGPGDPGAVARGRSGAGSSGLGLDIARRVAEGSGGRLELTAGDRGGTQVVLVLGPPRA